MLRAKKVCFIEKKLAPKKPYKLMFASFFVLSILFSVQLLLRTDSVFASSLLDKVNNGGLNTIGQSVYGKSTPTDLRFMIGNVINIFLSFLGLLVVIYILVAGYKWMTAGGDTKKVDDAKKQITNATIGLFIILASWGLTRWIIGIAGGLTNTQIDGY
jgi:hypothetical protein